jgi:tetratricopeptide (TPR) repeat protein
MMSLKRIFKTCWPFFVIALSVVLAYFPTFSGEFILDDRPLIEKNDYIRTFHSPLSYLTQEDGITGKSVGTDRHTGYYRPLTNFTYSIDYKLWGLNAKGFRGTNLLLHVCCCYILFCFLSYLVKNQKASLLAILIFAVHPANTEAVSWVVNRNNIVVTAFALSAVLFYMKGWESGKVWISIASLLTFSLALLSKELGLMVLPILFLYQRLLYRTRRTIVKELISYLPFITIAVAYFLLRKSVIGSFGSSSEMAGLWQRIYFAPYLLLWHLKVILVPAGIHSFIIHYPSSYFSWEALAGISYVGLSIIFIWKQRHNQLLVFSFLSFNVALLPVLNIFPHSGISLVSARWAYFPTAFLTIMFACVMRSLLKKHLGSTLCVYFSLLLYMVSYTYTLNNRLWLNEERFFAQEVIGFKNYYYAGGLADHFFDKRQYKKAEDYFWIAIQHNPNWAVNYINYSALLTDTGRPKAALACLEKARFLSKSPEREGQWYNNMGAAYFRLGNYRASVGNFIAAVKAMPYEVEFQTNLGGAYVAVGDYDRAIKILKNALVLAPDSVSVKKNLAVSYIERRQFKNAEILLEDISKKEWKRHGIKNLMRKVHAGSEGR